MHWLIDRIATFGDIPFLVREAGETTYADLSRAVTTARDHLAQTDAAKGDPVALVGDYSPGAVAWLLALAEAGLTAVPIATAVPDEVEQRIRVGRVRWRVDFQNHPFGEITRIQNPPESHELLARLATAGRAGLILFSSGSTGEPKAMVHDFDTLLDPFRDRRARRLTMMVFLMFDHIGGLNTLLHALASGITLVAPSARDPHHVAAMIAGHHVQVLPASPTFLNLLLMAGAVQSHDLSCLRIVTYGTEPMPDALLQRLRAALPKVKLIQTFGTSETGISSTQSASSESTLLKLDDPDVETRIVDGELWLRSKTQILGYLNHDMDSFTADGWFKTGDLVQEAENGFLRIVGRLKEMINVGGLKVLPGEVESVLLELPAIGDCLVYGEPNPITGQIVAAQIVLAQTLDATELKRRVRAHCHGRLDPYKVPVRMRIVERTTFGERFKKNRL
jgi:acyl-coenzyme A synthetase/AMP-(fatty) acid ligase